jgi:hypothetical protein
MSEQVNQALRTTTDQLQTLGSSAAAAADFESDEDRLRAICSVFSLFINFSSRFISPNFLGATGGAPVFQLTATQRKLMEEAEQQAKRAKKEEKKKHRFFASHTASKKRPSRGEHEGGGEEDPALGADLERAAIELAQRMAVERASELGPDFRGYGDQQQQTMLPMETSAIEKSGQSAAKRADLRRESSKSAASEGAEQANFADFSKAGMAASDGDDAHPASGDQQGPSVDWGAAFEQASLLPPSDSDLCLANKLQLQRVASGGPKIAITPATAVTATDGSGGGGARELPPGEEEAAADEGLTFFHL